MIRATAPAFLALARHLHWATALLCAAMLALAVMGQLAVVILRYVFGTGFVELQDAVAYAFAVLVVLGLPVALAGDAHVRVDVLRAGQAPRARRRTDIAAFALLLLPVFAWTALTVWPDIAYSWSIGEGSVQTGGLPGLFVVKTALPLACLLMIVQGAALLLDPGEG